MFKEQSAILIDGKVKPNSMYFKFENTAGGRITGAGQAFHKTTITHKGQGKRNGLHEAAFIPFSALLTKKMHLL